MSTVIKVRFSLQAIQKKMLGSSTKLIYCSSLGRYPKKREDLLKIGTGSKLLDHTTFKRLE